MNASAPEITTGGSGRGFGERMSRMEEKRIATSEE